MVSWLVPEARPWLGWSTLGWGSSQWGWPLGSMWMWGFQEYWTQMICGHCWPGSCWGPSLFWNRKLKKCFLKMSKLNSPRSVLFYCVLVPCQMVHSPLPLFKCPSSLWTMFALHGMCRVHPHPVAVHVAKSVFTPQIGLSCEKMNTCPCDFRYDKWHCCRVLTRSLPVTDSLTCEKVWQTSKQLTLNPWNCITVCVYLNCGKKRCWATVKCKLH